MISYSRMRSGDFRLILIFILEPFFSFLTKMSSTETHHSSISTSKLNKGNTSIDENRLTFSSSKNVYSRHFKMYVLS